MGLTREPEPFWLPGSCSCFLWGLPLIIAEYALERKYRMGVVATFVQAAGEKFAWMGAFVTFVATAITFFYSVVLGWCLYYFVRMLTEAPIETTETATAAWNADDQTADTGDYAQQRSGFHGTYIYMDASTFYAYVFRTSTGNTFFPWLLLLPASHR